MLKELKVRNFAIVEDGALVLGKGMTAFTGETGAGKSLLLDAITLLLGVKARSDLVRAGAKSAEVEGVFDLSRDLEKRELAATLGFEIDPDEDGTLFIRREISAQDGKNRIWIQGRSATRTQLQELMSGWVEVSGQHEFLRLGREDYILALIDHFGGLREETRALGESYAELLEDRRQLAQLEQSEAHREARLDYLKFQVEEFERAGIGPDSEREEERLVALRARLGSFEKIRLACENAQGFLMGVDDNAGVLPNLQSLAREMRPFANFGEDLERIVTLGDESCSRAHELSRSLERVAASLEADPEALENAESRLSLITRLKRKYNLEIAGLMQLLEDARQEIEEVANSGTRIEELRERSGRREGLVFKAASALHQRRVKAAASLAKGWIRDIRQLGMLRAELQLNLRAHDAPGPTGITKVEALFSANPGEPPKPMGRIASGGELSRIMLALKNMVAGRSEVGVYLFDEVDAGIGGETAQAVGNRLRQLASDNQVLVVTHLAQIAAKAHCQFRIQKTTTDGRTRTAVESLDVKQRPLEIARMLGDTESRAAQDLARELLAEGEAVAAAPARKSRADAVRV